MEPIVLDNTLPQAASLVVTSQSPETIEPFSLASFRRFANAYVATPDIRVVAPHKLLVAATPTEAFIKIWKAAAAPALEDKGYVPHDDDLPRLRDEFVASVNSGTTSWITFVKFQFTNSVATGFKLRVGDDKWRQRLEVAYQYLLSEFATTATHPRLATAATTFETAGIDATEYGEEIERLQTTIGRYALSYAFDWFARGYSYSQATAGLLVAFHELRQPAAAYRLDAQTTAVTHGLRWDLFLRDAINVGLIPRDMSAVHDVLRALRQAVTKNEELRQQILEWTDAVGSQTANEQLKRLLAELRVDQQLKGEETTLSARALLTKVQHFIEEEAENHEPKRFIDRAAVLLGATGASTKPNFRWDWLMRKKSNDASE